MPETFDSIIIGSSPLMLLIALAEREAGKRVCVVDKAPEIGGVWRTVSTSSGIEVEYACHLVEDFPGVYEYLQEASGERFEALDVQPIRVMRDGRRFPYSSRATLLAATAWSAWMMLRHWVRTVVGVADAADRERYTIFRQKVGDFFRHHLGIVFGGSTIKAPVNGYAEFIRALAARCECLGVEFRRFEVARATDDGSRWTLRAPGGETIGATEVHATTSAMLVADGQGGFVAEPADDVITRSVLVKVVDSVVVEPISYAAFWKDPEIVRVSRIDRPPSAGPGLLYLVQLGRGITTDAQGPERLAVRALSMSGITAPGVSVSVVDEIVCSRVPHDRQMPAGQIAPRFHAHPSVGNLASGVARWLRERRA